MPRYDYRCKECQHTFSEMKKIAERRDPCDLPCEKCAGTIDLVMLGTPKIVSGVSVTDKRPSGWKDVLSNIHQHSGKTSTIDV